MGSRTAIRAGAVALALLGSSLIVPRVTAQSAPPAGNPSTPAGPVRLRYSFQPDCMRKSLDASCDTPKGSKRLDFGPQIAVWLEKADGSFVDTLMVTNAVAVRGIGNRPGFWKFPSNWHFPYGKRKMVLPVWAHARGKLYQTLVMQDDDGSNKKELWMGFHESVSSPDPYYCLSFRPATWVLEAESVDAITCPTAAFNSSKGKFSATEEKSYYPPRSDINKVVPNDCDFPGQTSCTASSVSRFAEVNDLDAVAAATPVYGKVYNGLWVVPNDLPDGPYTLALEVSKEFDTSPGHTYEAYQDPMLPENGLRDNFGQPSVVYRVPFTLSRVRTQQAVVTDIAGYGDWDGASGTLHPADATIATSPGSGAGRLLAISRPAVDGGSPRSGRLHVVAEVAVTPQDCLGLPASNGQVSELQIPTDSITASEALVTFLEAGDRGMPVEEYEIRYREGETMTAETFRDAIPAPAVAPVQPGQRLSVKLSKLKSSTSYVVGVRARGGCVVEGPLTMQPFTTREMQFKQLSGCFVATAAYGSAMEPQVQTLREVRDRLKARSAFAATTVGIYERSSPPLAAVLRQTEAGRALVRAALAPLTSLVDAARDVLRATGTTLP